MSSINRILRNRAAERAATEFARAAGYGMPYGPFGTGVFPFPQATATMPSNGSIQRHNGTSVTSSGSTPPPPPHIWSPAFLSQISQQREPTRIQNDGKRFLK